MKNKIMEYNITSERDHNYYWQGHGTSYTNWKECATGAGQTEKEAFNDALDMLAQQGYEIPDELENEIDNMDGKIVEDREDWYFYVSIDVK